ncbi:MAG: hypothetical protein HZA34_00650 [Candidatus Pacebacteria bacterium]|nr:hypothetical protein [Candidatus Paceibacterota bacterium]
MPRRVDISPYINEMQDIQARNSDADCIAFTLKIIEIAKNDKDLFILLHHALPKHVTRNSRLAIFLTWGFHASNFSNEIQNLDQKLSKYAKRWCYWGGRSGYSRRGSRLSCSSPTNSLWRVMEPGVRIGLTV